MGLIHKLQNYDDPNSLASRFRRRRARLVTQAIQAAYDEGGACRIIDLGGRPNYWRNFDRRFLQACKVHVTVVNLEPLASDDPMFTVVAGSACDLPQFSDGAFDLAHSNSVLEHVGDWGNVEAFAAEHRRLARRYYVQTPYVYFPVEPHFSAVGFHWMPEPMRAAALLRRGHGFMHKAKDMGEAMRAVQHARLISKRMFAYLFPDAELRPERVLGLTKSLIAVRG